MDTSETRILVKATASGAGNLYYHSTSSKYKPSLTHEKLEPFHSANPTKITHTRGLPELPSSDAPFSAKTHIAVPGLASVHFRHRRSRREIKGPPASRGFFVESIPACVMNSTTSFHSSPPETYWGNYDEISKYNVHLNIFERLWAAWYAYMQNDVLATGIMSFVMHEVVYFGRSLPWIIIDRIPQLNKYKIQNQKVPTAQEQWNCAKLVLLSHFTVELPQIWLFHPMAEFFGMSTGVPFPTMLKMAYQIAVFFVVEDAWHYWSHRALHWGPLYKNIHKIHHQYSAPFGLAAEYASPIEVMILGLGTVGTPILWCAVTKDLHVLTMYIWIVFRLFQAIDAHSGYEFPWSLHNFLPFWAGASHHDVHHERFIGNYSSSFRWWDWIADTESGPEAAKKRRERRMAKNAKKVE